MFFLDGIEHHRKRLKIKKFLSAKAVTERHLEVMRRITRKIIDDFRREGTAKLEDLSFDLAIDVVGEILGLTNSDRWGGRVVSSAFYTAPSIRAKRAWLVLSLNSSRSYSPIFSFCAM